MFIADMIQIKYYIGFLQMFISSLHPNPLSFFMYICMMHFVHVHPHNLTDGRDLAVISESRQKAVGSAPRDGLWRQNITRFH